MRYSVAIQGLPPGLLTHNIDGGFVPSKAKTDRDRLTSMSAKAKKEVANISKMRDLEWQLGLYKTGPDEDALPTLPTKVLRKAINIAAKLTKDGQRVNRGLQIMPGVNFTYGDDTGKTISELMHIPKYRSEAVVRVGNSKIMRVRPIFPVWGAEFIVNSDPEMASPDDIKEWIEKAGQYIGVGDWRPDKGGEHGMFTLESFEEISK